MKKYYFILAMLGLLSIAGTVHAEDEAEEQRFRWNFTLGLQVASHEIGSISGTPYGIRFGLGLTHVPSNFTVTLRGASMMDGSAEYFEEVATEEFSGELAYTEVQVVFAKTWGDYSAALGYLGTTSELPERAGFVAPQAFEISAPYVVLARTFSLAKKHKLTISGALGYASSKFGDFDESAFEVQGGTKRTIGFGGSIAYITFPFDKPLRLGIEGRYYPHGDRTIGPRSGEQVVVNTDETLITLFTEVIF